jgi:hypothetical protein
VLLATSSSARDEHENSKGTDHMCHRPLRVGLVVGDGLGLGGATTVSAQVRRSFQHAGVFSEVRSLGVPGRLADGRMREDLWWCTLRVDEIYRKVDEWA